MKQFYLLFLCFVFSFHFSYAQRTQKLGGAKNINKLEKTSSVSEDQFEFEISDSYYSKTSDVHHIYRIQTHQGLPVYNTITNTAIRDGKELYVSGEFISGIGDKAALNNIASLSPSSALNKAAKYLDLDASKARFLLAEGKEFKGIKRNSLFTNGGISHDEIPVDLMWVPVNDGDEIKLAYNIRIHMLDHQNWWNIRVDAATGAVIEKNNWVTHCSFGHDHGNSLLLEEEDDIPENLKRLKTTKSTAALAANEYLVFDYPLESPNHGGRTTVASPYTRFTSTTFAGATNGWHDTGSNSYTYTRGNNVWAQDDLNNNNGTDGSVADGGANLDFSSFPYDPNNTATSRDAAITNLFYWINLLHDAIYNYGWDEPAGNFQENNFGRGGSGSDHVWGDAQDGGGTNNANFATPADGGNGRMQMYLWSPATAQNFNVTAPAAIAGPYGGIESAFSTANKIANVGPVSGSLVLWDDNGAATTSEACGVGTGPDNPAAINGNVAVIDRGNCSFTEKVNNAEDAGAIAVIVCNNVAGSPIAMGGTDNTITTPAIMLSQSDCNIIKAEMATGTVSIDWAGGSTYIPDGDFDNGIVAHELGHGWSIRLTGGPSQSGCLGNTEQMGEGWGDLLALFFCTDWGSLSPNVASANIVRGIGTYATGEPITGGGIRPFPYSYDTSINGTANYANVGDGGTFSIPHGVGSMWATMCWDMTWEIIMQDNFIEADIWNTSDMRGNIAAFKLINEGLALQSCSPGFVDGRDAILAADDALFGGKYKCAIWTAFARRGLGENATQGSTNSVTDGSSDTTVPADACLVPTPQVNFSSSAAATQAEGTDCNTRTVAIDLTMNLEPSATTAVSVAATGTADGADYSISGTNYSFTTSNWSTPQTITLTIEQDAVVEGDETIILDIASVTGSDAIEGTTNQITITLTNDDSAPTAGGGGGVETIWSEDFEGTLDDWFLQDNSGQASKNTWTIYDGNTDGCGDRTLTTTIATIFDDDNGTSYCDYWNYGYASDAVLLRQVDASLYTSITVDFDWSGAGRAGTDYGSAVYSTDGGTTWIPFGPELSGSTAVNSETNVALPASLDNSTFDIGWQWKDNGNNARTQPPLQIDNIVVKGTSVGSAIQTATNMASGFAEHDLGPNQTVHFFDQVTGDIMLTIENTSGHDYGCTRVEVITQGTTSNNAPSGAEDLASKSYLVTPATNNATGSYNITLYYTADEVNGWVTDNTNGDPLTSLDMLKGPSNVNTDAALETAVSTAQTAFGTDYTFTSSFASGFSSFGIGNESLLGPVRLNAKVFLQGPLSGTTMATDLATGGYIPTTEPYTALAAFAHVGNGGGETATAATFTTRSIVDWVFIELRDRTAPGTVLATRAALLRNDGVIVDTDGVSPVAFTDGSIAPGTYYVTVNHRNHLGVTTATDVTLDRTGGAATLVDFTTMSDTGSWGTHSQKDMGSGIFAMWAGDANMDGKVKYSGAGDDPNTTLVDVLTFPGNTAFQYNYDFALGYFAGDVDLNGKAKYSGVGDDPNIVLVNVLTYPTNTAFQYNYDFVLEQKP